jgi:LmbE family N-acetylglucosaminyl deacetylase
MNFYGRKVLFVGAHPDDIELGCGALIANMAPVSQVICATLSPNQGLAEHKNLVAEHRSSMKVLGVSDESAMVGSFETREFQRDRQEILEFLYALNKQHEPDVVFVHTAADIHQDHSVVTEESLRAFRGTTLLGFDVLRSSYGFFPHFLIEVSKSDVDKKLKALSCYETYAGKYYFDPSIIKSTLVRHGALAEREFAEGFDILRIVGKFADSID